jgi:signal transduction histidine kinase
MRKRICRTNVAVPLLCKDEIYGGIALYLKNKLTISEEEIELTHAFADQAALAIDNARLRTQAEKMAVSAERSRLARDLHDAVTQTLFSASLIAEVLPKLWERNPDEGRNRLEELRQLTRGALAEMRILLPELRPATLAEAKLEELMRQLAEATTGRARIPVTMQLDDCAGMNTEVKVAIYRIIQEAINNISKHSGASAASIKLRLEKSAADEEQQLELLVSDNGRGFDQSLITGDHLGLSIMKERADAIGAEFVIDSVIGAGTTIKIRWCGRCC